MTVMGKITAKIRNCSKTGLLCDLYFIYVIASGIKTSLYMNSVNRSLWLDEAALAYSFSTRSLKDLTGEMLEWNQTAPAGWLYANKILTVIFGNTEQVLRAFSIFSYIMIPAALYALLKGYFKVRQPLMCAAYAASMSFLLKYSNVFKPYIAEGFFVLAVIILWCGYDRGRLRCRVLAAGWSVLVWFANPACFFMGGFLICDGFSALAAKEWGKLKELLFTGACICASFAAHYFYWLKPVAEGDSMQNYWKGQNFPLIPASLDDLAKMKNMVLEIFRHFEGYQNTMLVLSAASLFLAAWKKNKALLGLYAGILLCLFASYINMFPVEDRMWCFLYPVTALACSVGMDSILTAGRKEQLPAAAAAVLGIGLVAGNTGLSVYSVEENVYWSGEEINDEIEYLQEHVADSESVYVYCHSVPGFKYKNGCDTDSIGGFEHNVIYGSGFFQPGSDYSGEINKILETERCYIAMSHITEERTAGLKETLQQDGYLELVRYEHATPLLYWCRNPGDVKSGVEFEVTGASESGGRVDVTLRINNTGQSYLNSAFNPAVLACRESGLEYAVAPDIAPGRYCDVEISCQKSGDAVFELSDSSGKAVCENAVISVNDMLDGLQEKRSVINE